MKTLIFGAQLLALLQLCKSQTLCTPDVAFPVDDAATSGSGSGSGSGSDADAIALSAAEARQSSLANIGILSDPPIGRLLRKRASVECTSSESCYSIQGSPFCADDTTNDFHDEDGVTGNLDTGDYTLPDGRQGNFITGPYPTLTASSLSTTFDAFAASATGPSDSSAITKARGSADATAVSTGGISTPTESAGSSLAAETAASASDVGAPTETADSSLAAETEASSPTRTSTPRGSASAASSSNPSAQDSANAAGAPTRYTGSSFALLAVMVLRAML